MIDFVQLDISNIAEQQLIDNTELDVTYRVKHHTGEKIYPYTGKLLNLDIVFSSSFRRKLKGSLHKYHNLLKSRENQNYDQFNLANLSVAIASLCKTFGNGILDSKIECLEYGLNLPIEAESILSSIITHRIKEITVNKDYGVKGHMIEFIFSDYLIKLYNKASQYGKHQPILRVEVKVFKSRYLKKRGIFVLSDLRNNSAQFCLMENLKGHIGKILIVDPDRPEKYGKYLNPQYWTQLRNTTSANFKYHWDKFNKCLETDQKNTIKNLLFTTIMVTWDNLNSFNNFTKVQKQNSLTNVPLYRGKV